MKPQEEKIRNLNRERIRKMKKKKLAVQLRKLLLQELPTDWECLLATDNEVIGWFASSIKDQGSCSFKRKGTIDRIIKKSVCMDDFLNRVKNQK